MNNILKSWSEFTYIFERISIVTRNIKSKTSYNNDLEYKLNSFYSSIRELNNSFINVYYYMNNNNNTTTVDLAPFVKDNIYREEINTLKDFNNFLVNVKDKISPCFNHIINSFSASNESVILILINSIKNFKKNLTSLIDITNNK